MKNKVLKPVAVKNEQDQGYDDYITARAGFPKDFDPWNRSGLLPNQTGPISKNSLDNDFIFTTAVDPRLTNLVQPCKRGPSNRRILIAVGMALGCGLTLLFEFVFGV